MGEVGAPWCERVDEQREEGHVEDDRLGVEQGDQQRLPADSGEVGYGSAKRRPRRAPATSAGRSSPGRAPRYAHRLEPGRMCCQRRPPATRQPRSTWSPRIRSGRPRRGRGTRPCRWRSAARRCRARQCQEQQDRGAEGAVVAMPNMVRGWCGADPARASLGRVNQIRHHAGVRRVAISLGASRPGSAGRPAPAPAEVPWNTLTSAPGAAISSSGPALHCHPAAPGADGARQPG